jgi:hypothetical protein
VILVFGHALCVALHHPKPRNFFSEAGLIAARSDGARRQYRSNPQASPVKKKRIQTISLALITPPRVAHMEC